MASIEQRRKEKPLKRVSHQSLPVEWRLPMGRAYTQLTLATCQLSKLPALQDNDGMLKPGPVSTMPEELYVYPQGLEIEEIDQAAGDADEDEEAVKEDAAASRKPGMRCVSLRLGSNNLSHLEKRGFESAQFLCSLDLATNHIERLDLVPDTVPRLTTLNLRNNRLGELGPLSKLPTLRRLDVSFNQITSLRGVNKLAQLRLLLAGGNQLSGELPAALGGATNLVVVDLSHNQLDGVPAGGDSLSGLTHLSTLKLSHNQLPPKALPALVAQLGRLFLKRLELYGNPLASDEAYPDELLRVQPKLVMLDHVRQPAGELAAGLSGGAVSSRSVAEAIDAVANSALAQHAVQLEQHRKKHASLLDTLLQQQEAAAHALDEYANITNAKISQFKAAVTDAKRTGKKQSDASVDRVLALRTELLTNEKICQERYRGRMADSITAVREALARLQGEVLETRLEKD